MSGTFVPDPSWPSITELAIKLWGQPNRALSTAHELRFGVNGSKSVKPRELVWHDHEANCGGGYFEIHRLAEGCDPVRPGAAGRPSNGQGGQHTTTPPRQPQARPEVAMDRKYEGPAPWDDIGTIYQYRDRANELVIEVVRTKSGKPRFRQRKPDHTNKSGWSWKTRDLPKDVIPLYRLPELLAARDAVVWLCEGEKDCDNLGRLGAITTTNAGGAAKWYPPWSEHLRDRDVIVLPDNDPAGEHHIIKVCTALHGVVRSLRVLKLPGLGHKGDVTDWLGSGGDLGELIRLAREVPLWEPPAEPPPPEPPEEPPEGPPEPPDPPDDPRGRPMPDGLRVITVTAGELPRMVREAEAALLAAGAPIYQRTVLVRPVEQEYPASDGSTTHSAALVAIAPAAMLKMLARAATWQKFDARARSMVACNPPANVVEIILASRGEWPFPVVRGVLTTPTIRPDGSLLTTAGYDPESRYFLMFPTGLELPEIPDEPGIADAGDALDRLDRLLDGYDFVEDEGVSRSVALAMLMTQVLRCGMGVSPLLAVSATAPGTGKSHLVDLASTIAIGRPCPIMGAGKNDEETEKGINTNLLSGVAGFSIDNVHNQINSPILNIATERPMIGIRLFGTLEKVEVENSVTIYQTGNNLPIIDEQVRRTLRCSLDAGMEQPEQREFPKGDPIKTVLADRGRYIADVLTIARAYHVSGWKPDTMKPFGSYPGWSHFVREPLIWLGRPDPVSSQDASRASDPEIGRLRTVMKAWYEAFQTQQKTLADAVRFATEQPPIFHDDPTADDARRAELMAKYVADWAPHSDLKDVLTEAWGKGRDIDTGRWGKWMRQYANRIVDGMMFKKGDTSHGVVRWFLVVRGG